MKKLVIIPGGFHPFHLGHLALYNSAVETFPNADVFVAATDDRDARPFPFELKKKLATLAGVPANRFIQVKSPFRANEITQMYDPDNTLLIFARSTKDRAGTEKMVRTKADGSPGYLQMLPGRDRQPMSKHGYLTLLPTQEFADGMTSATEIRGKWPEMNQEQKRGLIGILYSKIAGNTAAMDKVIEMIDQVIGTTKVEETKLIPTEDGIDIVVNGLGTYDEATLVSNVKRGLAGLLTMLERKEYQSLEYVLQRSSLNNKIRALAQYEKFLAKQGNRPLAKNKTIDISNENASPDYIEEEWSQKYKDSIDCSNPKGFSQRAHCASKKKK